MTVESILSEYRRQFPFEPGEASENRERFYWLSGFLRDVAAGVGDEPLCEKYEGKLDRQAGEFLKTQIEK